MKESNEVQRKEVFSWFGAASYYAQCIETEMWISWITLQRNRDSEPNESEWQKIESEKLTMGKLFNHIRQHIQIKDKDLKTLQICLKKRIWLVHKYWEDQSHLLFSTEGCEQAVKELSDLSEIFRNGDKIVKELSIQIRKKVGISEDYIQELGDEYIKRLNQGENHESILQEQECQLKKLSKK